jgi:CheY-like chemotaxis protein
MARTKTILFVDDDPDDIEFYGDGMRSIQPGISIEEASSGLRAMEYLNEAKTRNELPSLIVLDVNMPKMGGHETLLEIKKDNALFSIPVVIFSTASSPKEKECFAQYQVEFFTKPCSVSEMQEIAKRLLSYCG